MALVAVPIPVAVANAVAVEVVLLCVDEKCALVARRAPDGMDRDRDRDRDQGSCCSWGEKARMIEKKSAIAALEFAAMWIARTVAAVVPVLVPVAREG